MGPAWTPSFEFEELLFLSWWGRRGIFFQADPAFSPLQEKAGSAWKNIPLLPHQERKRSSSNSKDGVHAGPIFP